MVVGTIVAIYHLHLWPFVSRVEGFHLRHNCPRTPCTRIPGFLLGASDRCLPGRALSCQIGHATAAGSNRSAHCCCHCCRHFWSTVGMAQHRWSTCHPQRRLFLSMVAPKTRVRTDSSSDTDRGSIWLNLDWTSPGLTVTHVNGHQFAVRSLYCLCILNSRLVAYKSIFTYITLKSIQMLNRFIINT